MSCLAYPAPPILSTLLREFPKLSPLVRQIRLDAASLFKNSRQTQLPDKKLLQAKLHEFYLANVGKGEEE
jgi:hypothetical protein